MAKRGTTTITTKGNVTTVTTSFDPKGGNTHSVEIRERDGRFYTSYPKGLECGRKNGYASMAAAEKFARKCNRFWAGV